MMSAPRALLRQAFDTAVAAAHPGAMVLQSALFERLLAAAPKGRAVVLAIGKGATEMAAAFEAQWPLAIPPSGLVIAPHGMAMPPGALNLVHGRHPHADASSVLAGRCAMALVSSLGPDDRLLVLLSGGGSALTMLPVEGVAQCELAALVDALMRAGAAIAELNCVRKHLGQVGGGGLAAACTADEIDLIALSDVPGDDIALIASGPFCSDPTTLAEARLILERYGIAVAPAIADALRNSANETLKPGDSCFARVRSEIVPTSVWIAPCAALLAEHGYAVTVLGTQIDGEASDITAPLAEAALAAAASGERRALLSGGEATVIVRGEGYGGPSAEVALRFAAAVGGGKPIHALFADTDGIDGPTANAGGFVGPDTLDRITAQGRSCEETLARSDSAGLFDALGDSLRTGPTGTNVNDFRLILVN
jgi:hydroxypyruvate reductase